MVQEKREKNKNLDFEEIKKLIKMLEKSTLEELEVNYKDIHLRLKKPASQQTIINPNTIPIITPPLQTNVPSPSLTNLSSESKVKEERVVSPSASLFEVKSPMVGTFYRAPAPNAEPFVKVGDIVKKGKTLCIIEAMKIMNEIEAEVDGKIVEIKVQNADPIEYGEILMLIDTAL